MKAAGYIRVSTTDQIEGTSLDTQERQIRAYAELKGIDLVAIYQDNGISGGKPIAKRPEGAKLAELIEAGEIDAVIITKLDRGFRNTVDCLQTIQVWRSRDISLHVVDMGGNAVDTSTSAGEFMLTVLAAAAQMERKRITERCNEGRRARKAEGKRIGEVPFGFDLEPDTNKLIENSQEQTTIELMRTLNSNGGSFRSIAAELNSQGILTKKGRLWTHKQVANVLKGGC